MLAQQNLRINKGIIHFKQILSNLGKEINIPREMVEGLKNGTRKLRLRLRDYMGVYNNGVRNDTEIVFFGESNNELFWPEDCIEELLKVVFALHFTYVAAKYHNRDSSNNYNVYGLEFGRFHPFKKDFGTDYNRLRAEVNRAIAEINDEIIDLQLGTLVNHMVERMDSSGDMPLPSGVPRTNRTVAFMTLYAIISFNVFFMKLHPASFNFDLTGIH